MKHPLVTITIPAYNDGRTIEAAVKSAAVQLYPAIEILVIDNNSKDNTLELLKGMRDRLPGLRTMHLAEHGVENTTFRYHILESGENLGFAKGHNRMIAVSQGEFVLLLNSDAGLDDQFVSTALPYFARDPRLAAVQGKLFRYDMNENEHVLDEKTKKPLIDTTGLVMLKNRRIINRGQGSPDEGQFDPPAGGSDEVFGADGAAPMLRRAALDDVKICFSLSSSNGLGQKCEYLDEDFFMYKEDVDLAWRLRLAGWKTLYVPKAVGYHERASGESASKSYLGIIQERRKLSKLSKYYAFKNQRLMQIKNELPSLFFRDIAHWLPKELGAWAYILLFERFTWKAIGDIFRLWPKMLKKRKIIMAKKKATTEEMARWFV